MERVQKILKDEDFLKYLACIKTQEKGRKYCKHNMRHYLDTARIAYILNLEESVGIDKELIYAAAVLHDIGRWRQYEDGTPHNEAGAVLAEPILKRAGFSDEDTAQICEAILVHRKGKTIMRKDLAGLLYRADKLSRTCMFCSASDKCDWRFKNTTINM